MINGLTLLLWFVGLAICYGIGYLAGRDNEKEKRDKEVKVLNNYFRAMEAIQDEQERQLIKNQ